MNMKEFWSLAYKKGWASKDNLKEAVAKLKLKPEDYRDITGEDYIPPT